LKYIQILPLPEEKLAEQAKNEKIPLLIPLATARSSHRWICSMVYMLKEKVSSLRMMAITWTAFSDAALQACCKAAAHWGNAQAVTDTTVTNEMKTTSVENLTSFSKRLGKVKMWRVSYGPRVLYRGTLEYCSIPAFQIVQ
jgi:hypothetical protein